MIKVRSNIGEVFLMREEDRGKLGTDQRVEVYEGLPKGCHHFKVGDASGFICKRTPSKTRKFIGSFLEEVGNDL